MLKLLIAEQPRSIQMPAVSPGRPPMLQQRLIRSESVRETLNDRVLRKSNGDDVYARRERALAHNPCPGAGAPQVTGRVLACSFDSDDSLVCFVTRETHVALQFHSNSVDLIIILRSFLNPCGFFDATGIPCYNGPYLRAVLPTDSVNTVDTNRNERDNDESRVDTAYYA